MACLCYLFFSTTQTYISWKFTLNELVSKHSFYFCFFICTHHIYVYIREKHIFFWRKLSSICFIVSIFSMFLYSRLQAWSYRAVCALKQRRTRMTMMTIHSAMFDLCVNYGTIVRKPFSHWPQCAELFLPCSTNSTDRKLRDSNTLWLVSVVFFRQLSTKLFFMCVN